MALSMSNQGRHWQLPRGASLGRGARSRKPRKGEEEERARPATGGNAATKLEAEAYEEVSNERQESGTETDTEEMSEQDSPNAAEPTQCERNQLCCRGFKHGGKPGRCKLRAAQYEDAEYSKGRSDNASFRIVTGAEMMQSLSSSAVKGLEWLSQAPRHRFTPTLP